jgi:hypothetical protein
LHLFNFFNNSSNLICIFSNFLVFLFQAVAEADESVGAEKLTINDADGEGDGSANEVDLSEQAAITCEYSSPPPPSTPSIYKKRLYSRVSHLAKLKLILCQNAGFF